MFLQNTHETKTVHAQRIQNYKNKNSVKKGTDLRRNFLSIMQ